MGFFSIMSPKTDEDSKALIKAIMLSSFEDVGLKYFI